MVKRLEVESVSQTRRQFCQQACHAASLAALGVILPGCGGSPTAPTGGGGVPSLPVLNSTISGNAFTLTIDANSPLNTVGNAALVQASGPPVPGGAHGSGRFRSAHRHVHARGVHRHRLQRRQLRLPVPWVPLQHGRRGPERAGAAEPRAVCERVRQRRADCQRVNGATEVAPYVCQS